MTTPDRYTPDEPYWRDEAWLRTLYEDRGESLVDIAERVPVNRHKVRDAMESLGIDIRPAPHKEPDAWTGVWGGGLEFVGLSEPEPVASEPLEIDWSEVAGDG